MNVSTALFATDCTKRCLLIPIARNKLAAKLSKTRNTIKKIISITNFKNQHNFTFTFSWLYVIKTQFKWTRCFQNACFVEQRSTMVFVR